MSKSKAATSEHEIVFPVEGHFLQGVPAVPLMAAPDVARRLIRTGAFTGEAPALPADDDAAAIEVAPISDAALAALDVCDPPGPTAALPEMPANAGEES